MQIPRGFISILCVMTLISTGCSVPSLNTPDTKMGSFFHFPLASKPTEKIVIPTALTGSMTWHDENNDTAALCGALIEAKITMNIDLPASGSGEVSGSGKISYKDIDYSDEHICTDCSMKGTSTTFTITGTLKPRSNSNIQSNQKLTLHPLLNSPLVETATSASCFADEVDSMMQTQNLYFSLTQAGFFDEWSIQLPTNTKDEQKNIEKQFHWSSSNHESTGTLTLTY